MNGYTLAQLKDMNIDVNFLEGYGYKTNEVLGFFKGYSKGFYWFSQM